MQQEAEVCIMLTMVFNFLELNNIMNFFIVITFTI